MKDCGFNCNKWYELGVFLEAPLTERKQESIDTLEEMLEYWITNGQQQPSWDGLISAVENCGEKETANKMRELLHSDATPPTPIVSQQAQMNTKG